MTSSLAGRVLRLVVAIIVAFGLVVLLLLFVEGRDKSTFTGAPTKSSRGGVEPDQGDAHRAPPAGFRYATDPPTSGPHRVVPVRRDGGPLSPDELLTALEAGNVVLVYGDDADTPLLRGIANDVAGAFDPALVARGQAVILDRRPGRRDVVAVAWRRLLRANGPDDPRLPSFADAWLGHGAPGHASG